MSDPQELEVREQLIQSLQYELLAIFETLQGFQFYVLDRSPAYSPSVLSHQSTTCDRGL